MLKLKRPLLTRAILTIPAKNRIATKKKPSKDKVLLLIKILNLDNL